jgi:hypothetical protein
MFVQLELLVSGMAPLQLSFAGAAAAVVTQIVKFDPLPEAN